MDWFLYDNGLRHERVKSIIVNVIVNPGHELFQLTRSIAAALH